MLSLWEMQSNISKTTLDRQKILSYSDSEDRNTD
jgi:hypothetical protein